MKRSKILKHNLFAIVGLFLTVATYGQKFDAERSKVIDKKYQTDGTQRLAVSNSFGKIQAETWDKDEISVRIELIARADSDKEVDRVLNNLDVQIEQSDNSISFETTINPRVKNSYGQAFEINYTLKLPSTNPIDFTNKFGDIVIDDRVGEVKIDVDYGALKAERLEGQSEIEVSFGSANLKYLENAEVIAKYSNVEVEEAKALKIEEGFSDLEIESVDRIDLQSKYGRVSISEVGEIIVDVRFSDFRIGMLTGSIDMYGAYVSDFEIESIASTVESVELETKFGSSELVFDENFSAIIDVDLKFSDLSYRDINMVFSKQITSGSSKEYHGTLGPDKDSKKMVSIESSYGNYKLRSK